MRRREFIAGLGAATGFQPRFRCSRPKALSGGGHLARRPLVRSSRWAARGVEPAGMGGRQGLPNRYLAH
jgi:hypothetical protein